METTTDVLPTESSLKTQDSQDCNVEKINTEENATSDKTERYLFLIKFIFEF